MHELAAVGALVDAAIQSIAPHRPCRVDLVRVQRGSAFLEAALLQGFSMLSAGTPLEGARLEVEVVEQVADCPCGTRQRVLPDDLVGHIWFCPNCGVPLGLETADDLTLLAVTVTPLTEPHRVGG